MLTSIKEFVKNAPLIGVYVRKFNTYRTRVPAGHYYSPIVSVDEVRKRESRIYTTPPKELKGIDLKEEEQIDLMKKLCAEYYSEIPFTKTVKTGYRYSYDNKYFTHADATSLFFMMRYFKPNMIIEAGSGFSSAVMLDTNAHFLDGNVQFTFIEPYPKRLYSLLSDQDRKSVEILESDLQDIPLHYFEKLGKNDFLFIDSTHVSKTGSDVNYFLFEIFPKLKSGVIIHIHDIFYPFEYPKDWVIDGNGRFGWNEAYILRAFLMHQNQYEIILYNDFLQTFHKNWFAENAPNYSDFGRGGSIYLRKL